MIKHWTAEEESTLIKLKSQGLSNSTIAEELGRSLEAIRTRIKRLQTRGQLGKIKDGVSSWTSEEIEILHSELNYEELEKVLGKSRRAIETKCQKLGINK